MRSALWREQRTQCAAALRASTEGARPWIPLPSLPELPPLPALLRLPSRAAGRAPGLEEEAAGGGLPAPGDGRRGGGQVQGGALHNLPGTVHRAPQELAHKVGGMRRADGGPAARGPAQPPTRRRARCRGVRHSKSTAYVQRRWYRPCRRPWPRREADYAAVAEEEVRLTTADRDV